MVLPACFAQAADGYSLYLQCKAGARRNAITGIGQDAQGRAVLKLSISTPPVDGKANAAIIEFLAKEFAWPKSKLRWHRGTSSAHKTLAILGDPASIRKKLLSWYTNAQNQGDVS
jgi:uncharacterized protein (TIGR00251 family)